MVCEMHYSDGSAIINHHLPSMWHYVRLCGVVMANYDLVKSSESCRKAKRLCGVLMGDMCCEYENTIGGLTLYFDGGHANAQAFLMDD